jgi:hypothetical protein
MPLVTLMMFDSNSTLCAQQTSGSLTGSLRQGFAGRSCTRRLDRVSFLGCELHSGARDLMLTSCHGVRGGVNTVEDDETWKFLSVLRVTSSPTYFQCLECPSRQLPISCSSCRSLGVHYTMFDVPET